jgi:hypothetical protein
MGSLVSCRLPVVELFMSSVQLSSPSGGWGKVIKGRFPPPSPDRWDIFLSYCDKDRKFADRIVVHLKPFENSGVRIYSHNTLKAGLIVEEKARSALRTSVVVILLVSADYMASELMKQEFPDLLDQAELRGAQMLWVLAGRCRLNNMKRLTGYQQVRAQEAALDKPLDKMQKQSQDEVYVVLLDSVEEKLRESNRYPESACEDTERK